MNRNIEITRVLETFIEQGEPELIPLRRAVLREIKRHKQDNEIPGLGILGFIEDVMNHGGQSGIIQSLIYTVDCVNWYKRHRSAINILVCNLVADTGDQPAESFRGWEPTDPLALDDHNQNLLAWFSFEETCVIFYDALEAAGIH